MVSDKLSRKIVIVAGGAGLLGRKLVEAVMENGGVGIIADIDGTKGKEVLESLKKKVKGGKADFTELDITSKTSINKMVEYLVEKYGKVDALVNSTYPKNKNYGNIFENVHYEDFYENVAISLGGLFLLSQQLAIVFKKQGHGNIVNIASIYGVIAPRFEIYEGSEMTMPVEYAAIKSASIHLTRYIAKYFKGCGIRANSISPGGVLNGQPAQFLKKYNSYGSSKGMLDAKDLKGTLVYLLSEDSQYVNGQNIIIDDGFTL